MEILDILSKLEDSFEGRKFRFAIVPSANIKDDAFVVHVLIKEEWHYQFFTINKGETKFARIAMLEWRVNRAIDYLKNKIKEIE